MKIELDDKDIIQEMSDNHLNDVQLINSIIDKSTTSWDLIKEIVRHWIGELKKNDELDINELLKD